MLSTFRDRSLRRRDTKRSTVETIDGGMFERAYGRYHLYPSGKRKLVASVISCFPALLDSSWRLVPHLSLLGSPLTHRFCRPGSLLVPRAVSCYQASRRSAARTRRVWSSAQATDHRLHRRAQAYKGTSAGRCAFTATRRAQSSARSFPVRRRKAPLRPLSGPRFRSASCLTAESGCTDEKRAAACGARCHSRDGNAVHGARGLKERILSLTFREEKRPPVTVQIFA